MKPLHKLTAGEAEAEIEWIFEARAERYTWKYLAKKYKVSIPTLKKFLKGELTFKDDVQKEN